MERLPERKWQGIRFSVDEKRDKRPKKSAARWRGLFCSGSLLLQPPQSAREAWSPPLGATAPYPASPPRAAGGLTFFPLARFIYDWRQPNTGMEKNQWL
jgi:hypothetical protein